MTQGPQFWSPCTITTSTFDIHAVHPITLKEIGGGCEVVGIGTVTYVSTVPLPCLHKPHFEVLDNNYLEQTLYTVIMIIYSYGIYVPYIPLHVCLASFAHRKHRRYFEPSLLRDSHFADQGVPKRMTEVTPHSRQNVRERALSFLQCFLWKSAQSLLLILSSLARLCTQNLKIKST